MNILNQAASQIGKIYIVIPVHNRKSLTRECLRSLQNQTTSQFEIIVVDDGSTDGTGAMISEEFPKVTLLTARGDLWWTGSINKAVQYVLSGCQAADYILLLNDDLIVPPTYIATFSELIRKFPDTLIGSVVSTINEPDLIHSGGIQINWYTAKWQNLNAGQYLSNFTKGFYTKVSTLTGRGVVVPVKVFQTIGLYNQKDLPQHGDTEFPIRAQRAGFAAIVSYDVVVYSHIDAKGDFNVAKRYKLSDLKRYLFSKKSHCNIFDRFWFAYHTKQNIIQGALFFLFDLARILTYFIKRTYFLEWYVLSYNKTGN